MRYRVLNWLANWGWFRKLTDREVFCQECGASLGYVWLLGHDRWRHVDCTNPHDFPTGWAPVVAL